MVQVELEEFVDMAMGLVAVVDKAMTDDILA